VNIFELELPSLQDIHRMNEQPDILDIFQPILSHSGDYRSQADMEWKWITGYRQHHPSNTPLQQSEDSTAAGLLP
jgi:hypothetical protein